MGLTKKDSSMLADFMKNNSSLVSFDGGDDDGGAQALALALKTHPSLKNLDLFSGGIGDSPTLDFQDFGMSAEDAVLLADRLKTNKQVTSVDLSSNEAIGNKGASALAEALKVNTTLEQLDLSSCGIGGLGAKALAEALCSNTSLMSLNLEFNDDIGDQSKQLLQDAIEGRQDFDLVVSTFKITQNVFSDYDFAA